MFTFTRMLVFITLESRKCCKCCDNNYFVKIQACMCVCVCLCVCVGDITCEPPNNNLNRFEGVIHLGEEKYSLNNDKILLRGCVLRNTQWCYGLVIFAGKDTKLMMNSGQAVFKRTNIDRLLNILIIGVN